MIFKLSRQEKEEISYTPVIPPAMARFTIPDARGLYASGDFGAIIFYEMNYPEFSIRHAHYIMKNTTTFYGWSNSAAIEMNFTLHNRMRYRLEGVGEVRMPEGHFNMVYVPYVKNRVRMESDRHYTTLDISFSMANLERLSPSYPLLESFLKQTRRGAAGLIAQTHPSITSDMDMVIGSILQCEYSGDLKTFYLQHKTGELLLMAMARISDGRESSANIRLSPYDLDKIREARDYMLFNMDQPCTLVELAHRIGINDFKLKKGFKQLYGITIFDFLLEARINKARMLLEETNTPIQEIAQVTGYKNLSSFTAAFKKKTGYSPKSLQQRTDADNTQDWGDDWKEDSW